MQRHPLYEASATDYRIRYAIRNILKDRLTDEGAFSLCFEMEDEEMIVRTILRRGLRNPRLRAALERSHLIDLAHWLQRFSDLSEAYYADDSVNVTRNRRHRTPSSR